MNPIFMVMAGLIAGGVSVYLARSLMSSEARLRRRRRKNYGHTVSKVKGPTVKLAVKSDDAKQ